MIISNHKTSGGMIHIVFGVKNKDQKKDVPSFREIDDVTHFFIMIPSPPAFIFSPHKLQVTTFNLI